MIRGWISAKGLLLYAECEITVSKGIYERMSNDNDKKITDREKITLKDLDIGKTATVVSVGGEGALRQHFLDMGLIPGVQATMVKYAPMGDPLELRIHGYELTLRKDDAAKIIVNDVRDAKEARGTGTKGADAHLFYTFFVQKSNEFCDFYLI